MVDVVLYYYGIRGEESVPWKTAFSEYRDRAIIREIQRGEMKLGEEAQV